MRRYMKATFQKALLQLFVIIVALSFGFRAQAEPPRDELVHAYRLLSHADADYKGHREAAMDAVATAGREIGLKLEGDAPEAERQWKSDKKLEEARRLIREARNKLEARDRDRAAAHLGHALAEIDEALKVK